MAESKGSRSTSVRKTAAKSPARKKPAAAAKKPAAAAKKPAAAAKKPAAAARKPAAAAKKPAAAARKPDVERFTEPPTQAITIEIDRQLERLDQVLEKVREEVGYWAKKGVYTKVRFKLRGKPLLPDLPMAAFLAAEAATFWWGGLLRALAVNLGGRALFDVELISDAEPHLARGKEHLLEGDTDEALEEFYRAAAIDRNLPSAHLNIGIAHKVKGEKDKAVRALQRARDLDPHGDIGTQAQAQIRKILGD